MLDLPGLEDAFDSDGALDLNLKVEDQPSPGPVTRRQSRSARTGGLNLGRVTRCGRGSAGAPTAAKAFRERTLGKFKNPARARRGAAAPPQAAAEAAAQSEEGGGDSHSFGLNCLDEFQVDDLEPTKRLSGGEAAGHGGDALGEEASSKPARSAAAAPPQEEKAGVEEVEKEEEVAPALPAEPAAPPPSPASQAEEEAAPAEVAAPASATPPPPPPTTPAAPTPAPPAEAPAATPATTAAAVFNAPAALLRPRAAKSPAAKKKRPPEKAPAAKAKAKPPPAPPRLEPVVAVEEICAEPPAPAPAPPPAPAPAAQQALVVAGPRPAPEPDAFAGLPSCEAIARDRVESDKKRKQMHHDVICHQSHLKRLLQEAAQESEETLARQVAAAVEAGLAVRLLDASALREVERLQFGCRKALLGPAARLGALLRD